MRDNDSTQIVGLNKNIETTQLDQWANFYSESSINNDEVSSSGEWLHFLLEGQQFLISTHSLDEVTIVSLGITLPHLPSAALGLVNLRGDVVLTFDLGQMLNLRKDIVAHPNQRLVLLKDNSDELGQRSAFLVDEIVSVIEINESDLQSLRDVDQDDSGSYIDAVIESGSGESISRISPRALLNGAKRMLL